MNTLEMGRRKIAVGWTSINDSILIFYGSIYSIGQTPIYYEIAGNARILLGCLILQLLIGVALSHTKIITNIRKCSNGSVGRELLAHVGLPNQQSKE